MKSRCAVRYVRISLITIALAIISHWIKIHPIRAPCNRLAESSRFLKSVGCTIATSASPNKTVDSSLGRIVSKPIDGRYRSEHVENFKPSRLVERAALANALHSTAAHTIFSKHSFPVSEGREFWLHSRVAVHAYVCSEIAQSTSVQRVAGQLMYIDVIGRCCKLLIRKSWTRDSNPRLQPWQIGCRLN
jgi:hypothetical protein